MAGLNTLVPKPPKTILPKTMDITAASADIQSGMLGGRVSATKLAVTNAAIETLPGFLFLTKIYSLMNAAIFATATMASTLQPNRNTANSVIGINE